MKRGRTPRSLLVALDRVTLAMSRDVSIAAPEMLTFAGMQHMERTQSIFSDGNVVGVGIAEKLSEGRSLGDLGLVFYVRKKQALKDLDPRLAVPPIVVGGGGKAVFTDVVEVGEIAPEAQLNAGPPPLQSGFSISHLNGSAGTLGAFVRKGSKTFVLSNAHVLAQSGAAVAGDSILYPGKADGGAAPGSSIGRLETFTRWQSGKSFLNEADAALAEIAIPHLASLVAGIPGANSPIKIGDPVRGMKVIKRGRTSGDTESTVHDIDAKILVEYPGVGTVGFYGQSRCDRYTSAGDSGAIVVDKATGAVVGLHFAAAGPSSFFTPIRTVMRALRFQF